MWKALSKHPQGVGFLEVVMNMRSFAQFCENCFTLSFLVLPHASLQAYRHSCTQVYGKSISGRHTHLMNPLLASLF